MFGIIDENKKFILLDADHDKLRGTALMLAKEVEVVVSDYDEDGKQIGEHTEKRYEPMFTEETVDEAISEYTDEQIETAYNGDKYVAGYGPEQPVDEKKAQVRAVRDSYINGIEWRVSRYRDQLELEIDTDDTHETYVKILQYMQYLRDYPESGGTWYESNPITWEKWSEQNS